MPNRFSQASVLPYEPLPVEGLMKIGMLADENAQKAYDLAEAKLEYLGNIPTYYPGDKETIKNKINEANKQLADVTKTGSITDITNKVNGIYNQFTRDPLVNSIIERTDTGVKMDEWMDKNAKNLTDVEKSDWNIIKSRFMNGTLDPKDQELIQKGMRMNTKFNTQKSFEDAKKSILTNKFLLSQKNGEDIYGEGYFSLQGEDIKDPTTGKIISKKGDIIGDPRVTNLIAAGMPPEYYEQYLRQYAQQRGILTSEVDPKEFQDYMNEYAQDFSSSISHNYKETRKTTSGAAWYKLGQEDKPKPFIIDPGFKDEGANNTTESPDWTDEEALKNTGLTDKPTESTAHVGPYTVTGTDVNSNPGGGRSNVYKLDVKQQQQAATSNYLKYSTGLPANTTTETLKPIVAKAIQNGYRYVNKVFGLAPIFQVTPGSTASVGGWLGDQASQGYLNAYNEAGDKITTDIVGFTPVGIMPYGKNPGGEPVVEGKDKDGNYVSITLPENLKPDWVLSSKLRQLQRNGFVGTQRFDAGTGVNSETGNVVALSILDNSTNSASPTINQLLLVPDKIYSVAETNEWLKGKGTPKNNQLDYQGKRYYFTDKGEVLGNPKSYTPEQVDNNSWARTTVNPLFTNYQQQ